MIPLLVVLLPVVAALLTVVLGRAAPVSRRLAAGAVGAQLLPVLVLLLRFPFHEVQQGVAGGLNPAPAERLLIPLGTLDAGSISFSLSFLFGLDGLSLPFLLLAVLLFGGVIVLAPAAQGRSRFHYPLLLLLDAFLCGALVSLDGLALVICAAGVVIGAVAAACLPVSKEGSGGSRRFLTVAFGGTMLLCVTLMALSSKTEVVGAARENRVRTFVLPTIADRMNDAVRSDRALQERIGEEVATNTSDDVLFVLLLCFCGALMMIAPLHSFVGDLADSSSPTVSLLLSLLFPLLGLFLLIRIPFTLFPAHVMNPLSHILLAGAGGVTALYGGFVALGERRPKRLLRYVAMAWSGVTLLLLAFLDAPGIGAGLSGFFLSVLCIAGLSLLNNRMEEEIGSEHAGAIRGLGRVAGRWSSLFGTLSVLLALLPLFICWLLFQDTASGVMRPELNDITGAVWSGWMVLGWVGILFASIAVVRTAIHILFGGYPVALSARPPSDIGAGTLGAGVLLLLVVAVLSVAAVLFFTEIVGGMLQRLVELPGADVVLSVIGTAKEILHSL